MQRVSQAKHYAANRTYYQDRHREYRDRGRQWVDAYKAERGCDVCGEKDPVVLDLHHVDPKTKRKAVAIGVLNSWSIDRLAEEAALCRVVCANCHRREHFANIRSRRKIGCTIPTRTGISGA